MVVDTSAITAIILGEPEEAAFLTALVAAPAVRVSAATMVELGFVLMSRRGSAVELEITSLLTRLRVEVVSFDQVQAAAAWNGFRRFGKGRHRARLNLGDCFSYALAKTLGEPLLFKGDDFPHTDIVAAIQ
jgi:ribonuclease VapC